MAKQRLFPESPKSDDEANPRKAFDALALKVFTVPKSEIEKREKAWKRKRRSP